MRNELLDTAIDEIRKYNLPYRTELTRDRHTKIFIANSPMIVLVGNCHKSCDMILTKKIRADVRRSIGMIRG